MIIEKQNKSWGVFLLVTFLGRARIAIRPERVGAGRNQKQLYCNLPIKLSRFILVFTKFLNINYYLSNSTESRSHLFNSSSNSTLTRNNLACSLSIFSLPQSDSAHCYNSVNDFLPSENEYLLRTMNNSQAFEHLFFDSFNFISAIFMKYSSYFWLFYLLPF